LLSPLAGNLRALCPSCGTMMHKRMRRDGLVALSGILDVSIVEARLRLSE
jgi:hypothetical protein